MRTPPRERPPVRESVHLASTGRTPRITCWSRKSPAEKGKDERPAYGATLQPETVERDGLSFTVYRPEPRQGMPLTIA